jgi:hypothetical protein
MRKYPCSDRLHLEIEIAELRAQIDEHTLVPHHQGDLGAAGDQVAALRTALKSYSEESRLHDTECEVCKRMNSDEDSREFFRRLTAGATGGWPTVSF